jgi:hypothetical protein
VKRGALEPVQFLSDEWLRRGTGTPIQTGCPAGTSLELVVSAGHHDEPVGTPGDIAPATAGHRLGEDDDMSRKRSASECPSCKQAPKEDESGRLTCACGTSWLRCRGIKGTPEEEDLLKQSGFIVAQDIQEDMYYVGPMGHIVHLYADNGWDSDKAGGEQSLEGYLAWIKDRLAAIETPTRSV